MEYGVGTRESMWSMAIQRSVCIEIRYMTLSEEGRRAGE